MTDNEIYDEEFFRKITQIQRTLLISIPLGIVQKLNIKKGENLVLKLNKNNEIIIKKIKSIN